MSLLKKLFGRELTKKQLRLVNSNGFVDTGLLSSLFPGGSFKPTRRISIGGDSHNELLFFAESLPLERYLRPVRKVYNLNGEPMRKEVDLRNAGEGYVPIKYYSSSKSNVVGE